MNALRIVHFSDLLCIWAYIGQDSLYRLTEQFADSIDIDVHVCSVFPDSHTKIERSWRDRGGFEGYAAHVRTVADRVDGYPLHRDVWSGVRPKSSASPHLFLKAVELLGAEPAGTGFADRLSNRAARELRHAFFANGRDISDWAVQSEVADSIGVEFDRVRRKIETGEAIAHLTADYEMAQTLNVQGSPTYILNEGRQILFGNISYGILEANVSELLSEMSTETGSVC